MNDRPDMQPAFWCQYKPPEAAIAALAQMPEHAITPEAFIAAYYRDAAQKRNKAS